MTQDFPIPTEAKHFSGPDGITYGYTYDQGGRLANIAIPGQGFITYNSYNWQRPVSVTMPGGATRSYGYDPLMRLTAIEASDPGGNVVLSNLYSYDQVGNISLKEALAGDSAYEYDEVYRLIEAITPTADETYSYDQVGNRLTAADVTGTYI